MRYMTSHSYMQLLYRLLRHMLLRLLEFSVMQYSKLKILQYLEEDYLMFKQPCEMEVFN